jgi:type II secretory pathway component GspD/PulD (secretin)
MTLQRPRITVCALTACALAVTMYPVPAIAQETSNQPTKNESRAPEFSETVFLSNTTGPNDLNDIQTALRNNFPRAPLYGVHGQNALTLHGTADEIQGMKKMVAELDRPKKFYRITYNISDVENGKRTATQHYSLIVAGGGKTTFRQGNRVPLVTGVTGEGANTGQSAQIQYIDVGLSIDANIEGAALKTKVEQSSVAEEKSGVVPPDPIIRQTMLEGMSALAVGKPVVLGSLDVPGTTRRQEIEVVAELLTQ